MAPFYGWNSTASRLQSHYEEAVYLLTTKLPEIHGTHNRPQKDEKLSRPWSHPLVLNTEPLD